MYQHRNLEQLLRAMTARSHRCLPVSEEEMRTLLQNGGQVTFCEECKFSVQQPFWVEVELQRGHFYSYSSTDPRT